MPAAICIDDDDDEEADDDAVADAEDEGDAVALRLPDPVREVEPLIEPLADSVADMLGEPLGELLGDILVDSDAEGDTDTEGVMEAESEADADGLGVVLGTKPVLTVTLGVTLLDRVKPDDGEPEALAEPDTDGLKLADTEGLKLPLREGDAEALTLRLAEKVEERLQLPVAEAEVLGAEDGVRLGEILPETLLDEDVLGDTGEEDVDGETDLLLERDVDGERVVEGVIEGVDDGEGAGQPSPGTHNMSTAQNCTDQSSLPSTASRGSSEAKRRKHKSGRNVKINI